MQVGGPVGGFDVLGGGVVEGAALVLGAPGEPGMPGGDELLELLLDDEGGGLLGHGGSWYR